MWDRYVLRAEKRLCEQPLPKNAHVAQNNQQPGYLSSGSICISLRVHLLQCSLQGDTCLVYEILQNLML